MRWFFVLAVCVSAQQAEQKSIMDTVCVKDPDGSCKVESRTVYIPPLVTVEDQLAVSRLQIEGLKAALKLKDAEIIMLRAQLEMEQRGVQAKKYGTVLDAKEQSLKGKYKVPVGYVLTEDVRWVKGQQQGVTK